jgi:small subunit ribosomal protein S3
MAIERKFIKQNLKEFRIAQHVETSLSRVGLAGIKLRKTPLGDRIVLAASRPGLVVGRAGANISRLTKELKDGFNLENPQIEIEEVAVPELDPNIIAERIINSLERFGSARFKGVGHRAMSDVMGTGQAMGVEIKISGKIPSTRAKSWRFYSGYLKKCGDIAIEGVRVGIKSAILKTGAVGVQVRILPSSVILPDHVKVLKEPVVEVAAEDLATRDARALESQAAEERAGEEAVGDVDAATEEAGVGSETSEEAAAPAKKAAKKTPTKAAAKKAPAKKAAKKAATEESQ